MIAAEIYLYMKCNTSIIRYVILFYLFTIFLIIERSVNMQFLQFFYLGSSYISRIIISCKLRFFVFFSLALATLISHSDLIFITVESY